MDNGPTNSEILEAIQSFSAEVDGQFRGLKDEFRVRLVRIEEDLAGMRASMVTKGYLDDKLTDLRGDMVALTRKLNVKLSDLVEHLVKEGSLKQNTADLLLALEPFAQ